MIFDTHCHLYDDAFKDDLKQVINNSLNNNVKLFMVPSDNIVNSYKAIGLANEYEFIYCAVGVHPEEIYSLSLEDSLVVLKEIVKNNSKIKAIGEIGLDYFYYKEDIDREKQRLWFKKQIQLANELKLPIIVHSRDACEDSLNILNEVKPLYGCVFHCFSYSEEILNIILKRGYYIGLDGPVTYKNASNPKHIASVVPLDKLLLETDSPYLTPTPHRGKRNDPSEIIYIAQQIALLKGISYDELTKICYENGRKFFSI